MRALAKVVSATEAVAQIPSSSVVAVSGFVGAGHPELLTVELERRFLQTGKPPCASNPRTAASFCNAVDLSEQGQCEIGASLFDHG